MKKLVSLICLLLIALVMSACDNDSTNENQTDEQLKVVIEKPDFRDLLLDDNIAKYAPPTIRTESDLVSVVSPGCFLVNIRVYMSVDGGQEYQVANDNVEVGDCDDGNKMNTTANKGSNCSGVLPDGNLVVENNTDDEICLYELLIGNETAYNQYLDEISNY